MIVRGITTPAVTGNLMPQIESLLRRCSMCRRRASPPNGVGQDGVPASTPRISVSGENLQSTIFAPVEFIFRNSASSEEGAADQ